MSSEKAIRVALFVQQRGLCAYCETRLRDPRVNADHRTKIEHFHPQRTTAFTGDCRTASGSSAHLSTSTSWANMLLCCDGNEHVGENFTCDTLKGNTDICSDFRNPKGFHAPQLVSIERSGKAVAARGLPALANEVVNNVLGLNREHLVVARSAVMTSFLERVNAAIAMKRRQNRSLSEAEIRKLMRNINSALGAVEHPASLLTLLDELEERAVAVRERSRR